jgi:multimeric flavodoxin WrbA
MGGMESSMRAFCERLAPFWLQGVLIGKLGAAFATAGNSGRGGAELTLISLWANLAEHGLLGVPMHNRLARYDRPPATGGRWRGRTHARARPGRRLRTWKLLGPTAGMSPRRRHVGCVERPPRNSDV